MKLIFRFKDLIRGHWVSTNNMFTGNLKRLCHDVIIDMHIDNE